MYNRVHNSYVLRDQNSQHEYLIPAGQTLFMYMNHFANFIQQPFAPLIFQGPDYRPHPQHDPTGRRPVRPDDTPHQLHLLNDDVIIVTRTPQAINNTKSKIPSLSFLLF